MLQTRSKVMRKPNKRRLPLRSKLPTEVSKPTREATKVVLENTIND